MAALLSVIGLVDGVRTPAHAQPASRGVTRIAQLRNAPIPASCEHKASRLHGYSKNFGTYKGFATLLTKKAVFVALTGSGRRYAVVPLACSAGGVSWPEVILVYGAGPRLVGSIDLRRIRTAQEHEDVVRLKPAHRDVHLAFNGYDGAGFAVSTYRGTLKMSHHKVSFRHTGPLTIDYAADQGQSDSFGPGTYSGPGDGVFFEPAPKTFIKFVAHRYHVLSTRYGTNGTSVTVARFSHRGFAFGAESMGWESVVLYGRVKGAWARLGNWGDGPECKSLSRLQRRGLTDTHGFCFNNHGGVTNLGSWPHSGQ